MLRCRTPVQGELQEFERKVIFPTQMLPKQGVQSAGGCVARFVQGAENPPTPTQSLVKWLLSLFVTVLRSGSFLNWWRRQIEAHPMQCLKPRESLLAYSSSVTPYICCLRKKLSGAEGHLCGRTSRAWMQGDLSTKAAPQSMPSVGWVCCAFCCASSSRWVQPDRFFRWSGSLLGVRLCRRCLVFA